MNTFSDWIKYMYNVYPIAIIGIIILIIILIIIDIVYLTEKKKVKKKKMIHPLLESVVSEIDKNVYNKSEKSHINKDSAMTVYEGINSSLVSSNNKRNLYAHITKEQNFYYDRDGKRRITDMRITKYATLKTRDGVNKIIQEEENYYYNENGDYLGGDGKRRETIDYIKKI